VPVEYAVYGQDMHGDWIEVYAGADRSDVEGFYRRLKSAGSPRPLRLVEQEVLRSSDGGAPIAPAV
jgi:hypothetical protein